MEDVSQKAIRVVGVPNDLLTKVRNIAKYNGMTMGQWCRMVIRHAADKEPKHIQEWKD